MNGDIMTGLESRFDASEHDYVDMQLSYNPTKTPHGRMKDCSGSDEDTLYRTSYTLLECM